MMEETVREIEGRDYRGVPVKGPFIPVRNMGLQTTLISLVGQGFDESTRGWDGLGKVLSVLFPRRVRKGSERNDEFTGTPKGCTWTHRTGRRTKIV